MAYDAFISYSHTADGRLAPAVQAGLQRLARPWYRMRALRVFRDETGLAVNPHLWGSIETALDESEYFVLLASPDAAGSPWVAREIEHWIATKPVERILPVLTDGELMWDPAAGAYDVARSTALPAVLATAFVAEPRHLDLRWARTEAQLDLRHADFRAAIAGLAAPMHGVSRDELEGEDVAQHRRTMRIAAGAAALLLFVTIAAVVSSFFAVSYASTARSNERRAIAERSRARRNAQEATQQRTLAVQNASAARSAQSEAESSATQAAQNATEATAQRTRAEQNATESAKNAAQAQTNGHEAQAQSVAAQQNAVQASANAARASANAAEAEANARAAAQSAAEARLAADAAAAQKTLAEHNAATARAQRARAVASATVARSRQLAASALNTLSADPQRSLIMSAQGYRFDSNSQAQDSLMRTLQRQPAGLRGYVAHDRAVGSVASLVTSPSGRMLVTIGAGGRVAIGDLAAGVPFPAPTVSVQAYGAFPGVRFSPDGKWLVLETSSSLVLWDIARARTVATLAKPFGPVLAAELSRDRSVLAVTTADGIHLLPIPGRPSSAATVAARPAVSGPIPLPPLFTSYRLSFSADGAMLAVSGIAGFDAQAQVLVFDTGSGLPLATLPADTGSCTCLSQRGTVDLSFSTDNGGETLTSIASHAVDSTLITWRVGTWERVRTIPTPSSMAGTGEIVVAANADHSQIATADATHGVARIRDLVTGALVGSAFDAHLPFCATCDPDFAPADRLAFGPRGTLLAAGSDTFTRWFDPNRPDELSAHVPLSVDTSGVGTAAVSEDGRVAALFDYQTGRLQVFDAQDGHALENLATPPSLLSAVTLSPDGSRVALYSAVATPSGVSTGLVFSVWQVGTGRLLWQQTSEFSAGLGMAFDPTGQILAFVGIPSSGPFGVESLVLVDAASGRRIGAATALPFGSGSPAFSADGTVVAVGNAGPTLPARGVVLYSVAEQRIVRKLTGPQFDDVSGLAFSADGRVAVAYPLGPGHVEVLDAQTFAVRRELDVGFDALEVAISPSGDRIAMSGVDGVLQIFATDSGEPVGDPVTMQSAAGHGYRGLAFTQSTIISFGSTDLVRIDADPVSWNERACTTAGRNFTRAEWTALLGHDVGYQATCPQFPPG